MFADGSLSSVISTSRNIRRVRGRYEWSDKIRRVVTTAKGIRYSTYSSNMTTSLSQGEKRKRRLTLGSNAVSTGVNTMFISLCRLLIRDSVAISPNGKLHWLITSRVATSRNNWNRQIKAGVGSESNKDARPPRDSLFLQHEFRSIHKKSICEPATTRNATLC